MLGEEFGQPELAQEVEDEGGGADFKGLQGRVLPGRVHRPHRGTERACGLLCAEAGQATRRKEE